MLLRIQVVGATTAALALTAMYGGQAHAIAYASAVTDLGGGDFRFVLNEDADNVTVQLDGGPLDLGTLATGKHTFNVGGSSSWSIEVSDSNPVGWASIDDNGANDFLDFEQPRGLAVNTNPGSEFFGTIYVGNARTTATANGRAMGDGIYALSADRVDLFGETDPAAVTATVPGTADFSGSDFSSPFRMRVGADDNLYIGDWSDGTGGIKWASADLTAGGPLLNQQSGPTGGVTNGGGVPIHGSIVSLPNPTGSLGTDLSIVAMDEDLEGLIPGTGNHIWRWDLGSSPGDFDGAPTLLVDSTALGTTSDGKPIHLDLNIGVRSNVYQADNGLLYIFSARFDGNEPGVVVIDPTVPIGTDDDGDGTSDQVLWNSRQFAIDNGLDSFPDDPGNEATVGNNDLLRSINSGVVSPDGEHLLLKTNFRDSAASDLYFGDEGTFLVVPLDANGVPDIVIDDNGTPGDTSDDSFNIEAISTPGDGSFNGASELAVDAAGNVYISSNVGETISYFTPGGAFKATTASDGTFSLAELAAAIVGDYDSSGQVEQGDLDIVLQNWGTGTFTGGETALVGGGPFDGTVDQNELDGVLQNWGSTAAPDFGGSAVPEPAAVFLLGAGGLALVRRRVI